MAVGLSFTSVTGSTRGQGLAAYNPCVSMRAIRYLFVPALFLLLLPSATALAPCSWTGSVRDVKGVPVAGATVTLRAGDAQYVATSASDGTFSFSNIAAASYNFAVEKGPLRWASAAPIVLQPGTTSTAVIQLSSNAGPFVAFVVANTQTAQSSGGERLSSGEVSGLPLNVRDFSKLLLLAAGTMTDANGAANFTQQFAVNGQRGTATVFAVDGADTTDPEMGGATFSNFNVDAIQEVQSNSGVMPPEIGHGGASYTNVVSSSGTNAIHGSVFEFVRNAAFDARNYFDHRTVANPRRIPPFVRNEFGFTNGGPVLLPGIYDGRNRTFYFGEYQGFRQVLGTTQVFPVPTAEERLGIDTTTYPGDTLTIPVNSAVLPILQKYPLPNAPSGAYGPRTYAASSKVSTRTDQFSVRFDHHLSDKATLFARFSLNQVTGPLTNPDQTAIDPSFAIQFFDHQRNAAVKYARSISPHFSFETEVGYIRSTPFFPAVNHTQPAIGFGDGLFASFNAPGGSIFGSYSNLYQLKHDMIGIRGSHTFKWGIELRANRDSTIFGISPNGSYGFGGGTAYSPVFIPSASGTPTLTSGRPCLIL